MTTSTDLTRLGAVNRLLGRIVVNAAASTLLWAIPALMVVSTWGTEQGRFTGPTHLGSVALTVGLVVGWLGTTIYGTVEWYRDKPDPGGWT